MTHHTTTDAPSTTADVRTDAPLVTPSAEPFRTSAVLGIDADGRRLHTVRIPAGSVVEYAPRDADDRTTDGHVLHTVALDYTPTTADMASGYASLVVGVYTDGSEFHTVPANRCIVRTVPASAAAAPVGIVANWLPSHCHEGSPFPTSALVDVLRDAHDTVEVILDERADEDSGDAEPAPADVEAGRQGDIGDAVVLARAAVATLRELHGVYTVPGAYDDGDLTALVTVLDDAADRFDEAADNGQGTFVPADEFGAYCRDEFLETGRGAHAVGRALELLPRYTVEATHEDAARIAAARVLDALVSYVDWDEYATSVESDYSTVTFDGRDYVLV